MKTPTHSLLLVSFCVAFIGGIGLVGCSSSTSVGRASKGIDKYVQAVQAYQQGNKDRTVANLLAATRTNPDLIMARLMLGDRYRERGNYNEAVGQYEQLGKIN